MEDPSFTIRQMVVSVAWPGATASQMEEQVTDKIEKKLQDYSSRHNRCLESFIEQKAKSSQETPLYIPYYFVNILLKLLENYLP